MRSSHEIDYKIIGNDIQLVEIELDPKETVIAEAGAMTYMEAGIQFEAKMGDGSNPDQGFFGKLKSAGARMISGESIFMTHFTHHGQGKVHVAFSAPYPGTIIPINLSTLNGNTLMAQRGAFLCAALGTQISIAFTKRFGAGIFGGEGFILEKILGDGMAFIHAGGTLIEKRLNNETIRVDTGCIVAFENTIDYDVQLAGGVKSMLIAGEGMVLASLSGTGKVWLQSMPIRKLIRAIAPFSKASHKGGSSILGNLLED